MNNNNEPVYLYFINLDERGEFNADVRDEQGDSVYEISDSDAMISLVENGFMRHARDVDGLCAYLREMGVLPSEARLLDK